MELYNCFEKEGDLVEFTVQNNILKSKPIPSEAIQSAESFDLEVERSCVRLVTDPHSAHINNLSDPTAHFCVMLLKQYRDAQSLEMRWICSF